MNRIFYNLKSKNYSTKCSGISLISVLQNKGQSKSGTEKAPLSLISYGAIKNIQHLIRNKIELGFENLKNESKVDNCGKVTKVLADTITSESIKNNFCLTLGGDHSIGTGTVSGMLKTYPNLCVIWIDAHADINTYESSLSKNVHGMPISFVIDDSNLQNVLPKSYNWVKKNPLLKKKNIGYIGLRDVDPFEMEYLKNNQISSFFMNDVDNLGIHNVVEKTLKNINPNNDKPILVSFDVDSLDPIFTPSTGTPGGLTIREAQVIANMIKNTNNLVGLDIVEVNPLLSSADDLKKTLHSTKTIIDTFILGRQSF